MGYKGHELGDHETSQVEVKKTWSKMVAVGMEKKLQIKKERTNKT